MTPPARTEPIIGATVSINALISLKRSVSAAVPADVAAGLIERSGRALCLQADAGSSRAVVNGLETYRSKRDFGRTPEPKGRVKASRKSALTYLIQRHAATRLHYDFRIEHEGVLKSWAVTKAPSRDPYVKRLAVEVEDHPIDYGDFEGSIPAGGYGAGTVQLWDRGEWRPQDDDVEAALARGSLKMILDGERLSGGWALVRLKSDRGKPSKRNNWLLIKEKDDEAVPGEGDANMEIDASVVSGRTMAQIADGDEQWT
ncbi:hypothetical protein LTR94_024207, partial [Friedmanniomyces endolithicus]